MQNRLIIPLLCAAALAFACGPWSPTSAGKSAQDSVDIAAADMEVTDTPTRFSSDSSSSTSAGKSKQPIATTFEVTVDDGVHFVLRVTNNTGKLTELRFPNGQTHDFVVLDSTGNREIWRWSKGRMFTQALRSKMLHSHKSVTFEDEWDAGNAHGTFTAVAVLNTEQKPVEKRVTFTLVQQAAKLVAAAR